MISSLPPVGGTSLIPKLWASTRPPLGSGGSPGIVLVSIRQVKSPYYTKPKPVNSSVDTQNSLAVTVMLATITYRVKG